MPSDESSSLKNEHNAPIEQDVSQAEEEEKEQVNAHKQVAEQEMHAVAQDPDQPRVRPQMQEFLNPRLSVVVEMNGESQSVEVEGLHASQSVEIEGLHADPAP